MLATFSPRFFIALWFVFIASALSSAQAQERSLSGVVQDPAGRPVPNAVLRLYSSVSLLQTAQTTADGSFSFRALPPGSYLIECIASGFQEQSRRLDLTTPAQTLTLTLQLAGLHQRITVVASDAPQPPSEIAKSVSLISSNEIETRDLVFVSDALRSVPALQVLQSGGPGRLVAFRFRGMRPEDTAILLDGFRLLDPSENKGSARPFLSDILLGDADRLEILRGSNSTLYGTHAMGGLINIIPRQPAQPLGGSVSLEGGSLGLFRSSATLGGLLFRRRFSYSLHATHVNYTEGLDVHDDYRNSTASLRLAYDLSPQARLSGRFLLADSFAFLDEGPSPVAGLPPGPLVRDAVPYPRPDANFYPQLDDPDDRNANRFHTATLRLEHAPAPWWTYALSYQNLRTRRLYRDGPLLSPLAASLGLLDFPSSERYRGELDEALWQNSFQPGASHSLQFGLGWERAALDQTAFGLATHAVQKSLSLQTGYQTRWLAQRLHLQLAGRAQYFRLEDPRFSDNLNHPYRAASHLDVPASYNGDAAVAYFFSRSGTKLRLHFGNGFRAPSLYERFGSGGGGSYYGYPLLEPERSVFFEGGLDQFLFGDAARLSATYFYTRLDTFIDFVATPADPFGRFFGYLNRHGGNSRGVELSLSARPRSWLELAASYTYTNSDQLSPTSAGTTRFLGLSDHQFTLGLNVRPLQRLDLHWQTYAVSDHDFPLFGSAAPFPFGTYRFAGYVRSDLAGSWLLHRGERAQLRLVAAGDNLFNREYYHGGYLLPKAAVRGGLRWSF